MAVIDLGASVKAVWAGAPAGGTHTVALTRPDGTTFTPPAISGPPVSVEFTPDQAGRWLVRWTSTVVPGAYSDVVDVWPADPRLIISLDDGRAALNMPPNTPQSTLEDLRLYLCAATPVIEDIVGPVLVRTLTQTVQKNWSFAALYERAAALVSVVNADASVVPATSYTFDAAAGLINGKPAVMAGCFGSHLGIVDLRLARDGGGWRTLAARSQAQPMAARGANGTLRADAPGQTAFLAGARNLHAATRRYMARPVGQTGQRLSSHFALVADTAALRLVAAAMADHVRAALKGTGLAGLPVVAAAAPFKAGGRGGPFNFTDIPAGPLARRHVADLYPFTNTICAVLVSGAGLRDWLERSAALYRRLRRGDADQPLIDPDFPSYNFDMMLGLSYRVAPARPALFDAEGRRLRSGPGRILDLRHRGRAVAATDRFVVATNSYRLATWRTGPGCPAPEVVAEAPLQVREVLAHWIAAQAGPVPLPPPGWSLCLPPGAGVLFDTSPLADPSALSPLAATRLGPAPGGFARFRLSA